MREISLCKNWTVRQAGKEEHWTTDVPAMVCEVLYSNNVMEDPYVGENEWKTYELLKEDYEFTNTFTITAETMQAEGIELKCEGLDTVADVYINEKLVASVNDMHRTYRFQVKEFVHEGENQIRIYFHSAIEYALEQHEKEPYYTTSDTVDGFSLVRKAHCSYGWDWGPRMPDMGIWRNICLVVEEDAAIEDVYIHQFHEDGTVRLAVDVEVKKFQDMDVDLEMIITDPNGEKMSISHEKIADKGTYEAVITSPQLWWCHGFGEQPLYNVEFVLQAGGKVLHTVSKRIGLRTLTVRTEKDQWGESFEFCLNGVSVFAMGADYIPQDCFYTRCGRERSEKLLKQCVKANYNSIRVWGGGYFEEDYFYDLCDEYGLIVWQDMLFACGVYRLHDDFVENVIEETKDNVRRLRHHACIGLWCGNNELEWGWSGWDMGFGDKLSDKKDYLNLFEWILPRTVKSVDPDRFYWLASPSSGGSFDDPNDQNRGDVHYWEVWHRLKHFTEYRKYFFRFCSEFGFQSFPCEKTINTFATEADKNIFSPVMENHQKNGGANGYILYYMSANFRYPSNFEHLLYVSQILQAEAIRYGVEHWRSNRGRCMGSMYWQVNDCWPVASWSSLDYYNRWKPLHYYAKKFYAPVLLSALEEKGNVRFVVSNETMSDISARVVWRLRDNQGNIVEEKSVEHTVDALTAKECAEADYAAIATDRFESRKYYLEYILYVDGVEASRNTVLFARPKHFEFLNPGLNMSVEEKEDEFVLTMTTENFAKYVVMDHPEFDFVSDDNCFDISAGEPKVVVIKKEDITKDGEAYAATIEEMNQIVSTTVYEIDKLNQ